MAMFKLIIVLFNHFPAACLDGFDGFGCKPRTLPILDDQCIYMSALAPARIPFHS